MKNKYNIDDVVCFKEEALKGKIVKSTIQGIAFMKWEFPILKRWINKTCLGLRLFAGDTWHHGHYFSRETIEAEEKMHQLREKELIEENNKTHVVYFINSPSDTNSSPYRRENYYNGIKEDELLTIKEARKIVCDYWECDKCEQEGL